MTLDIRRILRSRIEGRTLVRVFRSELEATDMYLDGVPVAVGSRWAVFVRFNDSIQFDGYVALRLTDITRVQQRFRRRGFYVRGLGYKRAVLPMLPQLKLNTTQELLRSAQKWFSLLVVNRELVNKGANEIGQVVRASAQSVQMRLITPSAKWTRQHYRFRTTDVSWVGFGAEYENTLAVVAGLPDPLWK